MKQNQMNTTVVATCHLSIMKKRKRTKNTNNPLYNILLVDFVDTCICTKFKR